jgi:hypothetical protein
LRIFALIAIAPGHITHYQDGSYSSGDTFCPPCHPDQKKIPPNPVLPFLLSFMVPISSALEMMRLALVLRTKQVPKIVGQITSHGISSCGKASYRIPG